MSSGRKPRARAAESSLQASAPKTRGLASIRFRAARPRRAWTSPANGLSGTSRRKTRPSSSTPRRSFLRWRSRRRPTAASSREAREGRNRGSQRSDSRAAAAAISGHSARTRRSGARRRRTSGILRGLVLLAEDLGDFAEGAVAVQQLDLLEPVEHAFSVQPVAGGGALVLADQAHHRVVVDGLPGEAAVLHHFA